MNLICGLGCFPWLFYILYYRKIYKIPILHRPEFKMRQNYL